MYADSDEDLWSSGLVAWDQFSEEDGAAVDAATGVVLQGTPPRSPQHRVEQATLSPSPSRTPARRVSNTATTTVAASPNLNTVPTTPINTPVNTLSRTLTRVFSASSRALRLAQIEAGLAIRRNEQSSQAQSPRPSQSAYDPPPYTPSPSQPSMLLHQPHATNVFFSSPHRFSQADTATSAGT